MERITAATLDSSAQPRRALLVSNHPATIRAVSHVLGAIGFQRRPVVSVAQIPPCREGEFQLALVDLDTDREGEVARLVAEAAERCPGAVVVTVAGYDARRRLLGSLAHPVVCHAVPKMPIAQAGTNGATHPAQFEGPDERDLFAALSRRARGDFHVGGTAPLGIAPHLIGSAIVAETWLAGSSEKDGAVQMVAALGERMQLHEEKLRRIETLVDELLSNAIYDAPTDEHGARLYVDLPRNTEIKLSEPERVRLRYGCDGRHFAIAITDGFGSLSRATVLEYLSKVLIAGGVRTAQTTGGAGVGLVMSFIAANQLTFSLVPRRHTEVVAVVDIGGSNRASAERGTALHFFGPPPGAEGQETK